MRASPLLLLALCVFQTAVASSSCSSCRYAAWNCSPTSEASAVAVCNAQGQIQIDDVFCDGQDCTCAADGACVSLSLGCKNLFQARNRRRCVSPAGLQTRFETCGGNGGALTAVKSVNLASDWVFFRSPKKCTSSDCKAVQRFEGCGLVQCGRIVVAWSEQGKYHVVVEGSRASDMAPGTFHFVGEMHKDDPAACTSVTSEKIETCNALNTRNQKNGTCDGVYLQLDQSLKAQTESVKMSELNWTVYLVVVGSVVGAAASIVAVGIVAYRAHKAAKLEQEFEDLGLLDPDTSTAESPELVKEQDSEQQDETRDSDLRQRSERGPLPRP